MIEIENLMTLYKLFPIPRVQGQCLRIPGIDLRGQPQMPTTGATTLHGIASKARARGGARRLPASCSLGARGFEPAMRLREVSPTRVRESRRRISGNLGLFGALIKVT